LLGVSEQLSAQVAVGRVELKKGLAQVSFVMADGDDFPGDFPDPDFSQVLGLQRRVEVHVFPHRFEPVAIGVAGLVMLDQKCADALVIFCMEVRAVLRRHVDQSLKISKLAR
jgi:hypothetical protein